MNSSNEDDATHARAPRCARVRTLRYEAVVLLAACLLYGLGLGALDFWAPDEPRYGAIAEELRASARGYEGAVLLRLNDVPYTQKPPLFFWLAAAAGAPGERVTERAARLPSALAGIGCIALTLLVGRRLVANPRLALIAAALLATSFRFAWTARRAQLDVVLTLFELAAFAIFAANEFRAGRTVENRSPPHRTHVLILHLVLGLGALTKGPVAWLPLLVGLGYFAWEGRLREFRGYVPIWAWTLSLGPVAIWISAAIALAPPGFADVAVVENLIGRFVSGTAHVRPFYYFAYQTPADFLPWTPLFLLGAHRLGTSLADPTLRSLDATSTLDRSVARFLGVWLAVPFLFFSISAGKRGVYLLPIFPALALVAALGVERLVESGRTLFRPTRIAAFIAAIACIEGLIFTLALPRFETEKSPRPIALAVAQAARPGEPVAVYGLEPIEGALGYYADVTVTSISGTEGPSGVRSFLSRGGRLVLLRTAHFDAFADPLALRRVAAFRSPPRQLVLAERSTPWLGPDSPGESKFTPAKNGSGEP